MRLFKKPTQEEFEKKLKENDDNFKTFQKYARGRDVKTFEGTKEQLEEKLGETLAEIKVTGGFIEYHYKNFEFIGRLNVEYLVEYQFVKHDKNGEPIYKGKPVRRPFFKTTRGRT